MCEKLLTIHDIADRLSISARTVYRLVEDGQLKAKRVGVGRGTIRVKPSDLDLYINQPEPTKTLVATGSLYD